MTGAQRLGGVSAAEILRRHRLLADICKDHRLGAIVVLGNEDDMSGYIRWFMDEPVASYRTAAAYLPGEGVSIVEHGSQGGKAAHDPLGAEYRGVFEIRTVAAFQSAHYSLEYEGRALGEMLRHRGLRRIGVAGGGNMPRDFLSALGRALEGAELVDVTEAVDLRMVVKSAEEQALIRAAAHLQDQVFDEVLAELRPGMREIEVTALGRAASLRLGGAGGVILVGSAPQGGFAPFNVPANQARVIREGDYISLLIENAGPSGHFTEVARNITFGPAQPCLLEASEIALELQNRILALMRAGMPCTEAFALHNGHRREASLPEENRIFAHGQGYFLVERPLIRHDEPMALRGGMNLAVHPTLADGKTSFALMCDNFLLPDEGAAERLHRTPQKVFEV